MGTLVVNCRACGTAIPVLTNVPEGVEMAQGAPEALRVTVKCPRCKVPGSYPFAEVSYQANVTAAAA